MVRRMVLIAVLVGVIFFALSENEAWLHRRTKPLRETVTAKIAGIQASVSSFLSSKQRGFNEKINSEIDRIGAKIEGLKLGQESSQGRDDDRGGMEAAKSTAKEL